MHMILFETYASEATVLWCSTNVLSYVWFI